MPFLKLEFEKRQLVSGESPESFFERLGSISALGGFGEYAFVLRSGQIPDAALGNRRDKMNVYLDVGNRYSYVGYDPFMLAICDNGMLQLKKRRDFLQWKKNSKLQLIDGDPLQVLRGFLKNAFYKGRSPVPFFGGACGFFSYDYGTRFVGVTQRVFDDLKLPDFAFGFYDKIIAFDHQANEVFLLASAETDILARRKLAQIKKDLLHQPYPLRTGEIGELKSNLSFEQYQQKIAAIHDFLRRGESYQVNFSQRFSAGSTQNPWKIFKKLNEVNPAPFSCFFEFGDFQIMSASPELLLRKRGSQAETWPIKGTAKRIMDGEASQHAEDDRQIAELLSSAKNAAELAMIVDLERNDLGKVCEPGSVKVESHREIQKLPHLIHTFSRVSGKLKPGRDFFDVLEAIFPGGSVTGCPKKRTMEIIDQLEEFKRSVYTGSAGFINFAGDSDLNILIRTILQKDSRIYFQAGGGILIDSDARAEYEETLAKARGLFSALEI